MEAIGVTFITYATGKSVIASEIDSRTELFMQPWLDNHSRRMKSLYLNQLILLKTDLVSNPSSGIGAG